jgi:CubicO group peptidase (beta-lactamase class C family)
MHRTLAAPSIVVLLFAWSGVTAPTALATTAPAAPDSLHRFVAGLDSLAHAFGIPGMSALVRDGSHTWKSGYGYADLERKISATPGTPYRLASLTKPIAAALLMRLVEEGRLDLDAPMKDFTIHPWFEPGGGSWAHYPSRYVEKPITVHHVLTHTSEADPPGSAFKYNGNIFADLTWVIEDVTGQSYPVAMRDSILNPFGMTRSLPGQLAPWGQQVAKEIARPYALKNGSAVPGTYPGFGLEPGLDVTPWNLKPDYRAPAATDSARRAKLGVAYTPLYSSQTAAGMVSTVEDLARFDAAFDAGKIVSAATRERMFTPSTTATGEVLQYGLGWFVETIDGRRVVWHYGWFPPTVSALYVKLPDEHRTFILLANCDALSAGMAWTAEGLRASPFARLFLECFPGR